MPDLLNYDISQLIELGRTKFFLITVVYFFFIYFLFTTFTYFYITKNPRFQVYQKKAYRPNQIRTEIKRSLVSILMFGVLSFPMYEGLKSGFFKIHFEFTWYKFIFESFSLFFWNELHFYIVHRTFHLKRFYKWHADHHYSNVPSPFSAYSFHWSEGLLLGAVMPAAMCLYDFEIYSLMSLPITSILLNVLGHSNVDFFPDKPMTSLFSFSKRHSQHHKIPHTNYGFFWPYFDIIFKTTDEDNAK